MKHIKLFKNLTAIALSAIMAISATIVSHAEEIKIGEYDCYIKDDEYFTVIDGREYMIINLDCNDNIVTDAALINELNAATISDYPQSSWGNKRLYDLRTDGPYSERVNLNNGTYYSPSFITSVPCGNSIATITVDYIEQLGLESRTIPTLFYYRVAGVWYNSSYNIYVSALINYHWLDATEATSSIDRMAIRMTKSSNSGGTFNYTLTQF